MNRNSPIDQIYLTSRILAHVPGLVHGFFTRQGGVSTPPYESLNVSWANGDSPQAVQENLFRVRDSLGLRQLISSRQVHGASINWVGEETTAEPESPPALLIAPPGDALATSLTGTGLLIKVADCQSIMLVHPPSGIIANIHSGWRGSVQNIAGKTAAYLCERFGCDPGEMLAAVGPSLCPCCAEFRNFRNEIPEDLWRFQVRPLHFDFWAITRFQLTSAGLRDENIDVLERCTACGTAEFFSYRGERAVGRMASVIGWI